jgi:hypothetical protein
MTRSTPVKRLQIWDTAPRGTRGWREALHGEDSVFPPLEGVRVQGLSSGGQGHTAMYTHLLDEDHMCFASKIGHLDLKSHKWHIERASRNALQTETEGPFDTINALSSALSSPKNPALLQRLAVIVTKLGRQEQQKLCLAPKTFCECLRFCGQALWQTMRLTAKGWVLGQGS